MTRINLIPVEHLTNQHLLAEHREIKRVPNIIKSGKFSLSSVPKRYVMWTWHVAFFYNKLAFLHKRYISLYMECINRGFNITNYIKSFDNLPKELYNDYTPSIEEVNISRQRITEKIIEKQTFYKFN